MSRYPQSVTRSGRGGLLANIGAAVAGFVHRLATARRRRLEQEREFYRQLNEYRRAHNLPLLDTDDWKSWVYQAIDERRR